MYEKTFWVYNRFTVQDGQPTSHPKYTEDDSHKIKAFELLYITKHNENIWNNAPEKLVIFANKNGIGFEHEVPAGYSSYTYDPDTTSRFYFGADLDWFMRNALDQEQRDMLSVGQLQELESLIKELQ